MKIWVVLPAYNEEQALPLLLDSLIEVLKEDKREYSIVVVNDGSKDGTSAVSKQYGKSHPVVTLDNDGNKGLAETMRNGLVYACSLASEKDIIITMDADNTHPAGLMLRMIRQIREGNDLVIASRYREGSAVIGVPKHRVLLSYGAALLFRIAFPMRGVRDYTCGYRAYRADLIQKLMKAYGKEFISERGFSCMVDILLRMRSMNPVCAEAPLVLRYDLKPGLSKMKVMQTVFDTLKLLVKRRLGY